MKLVTVTALQGPTPNATSIKCHQKQDVVDKSTALLSILYARHSNTCTTRLSPQTVPTRFSILADTAPISRFEKRRELIFAIDSK